MAENTLTEEEINAIGRDYALHANKYEQENTMEIKCEQTANLPGGSYWYTEPVALDEQNGYIRQDGTVGTLTTDGSSPKHNNRICEGIRIRKLTPKECFRLQGVKDEDFERVAKNQSDSSLFHLAGDSIVVDVLMAIFKEIL